METEHNTPDTENTPLQSIASDIHTIRTILLIFFITWIVLLAIGLSVAIISAWPFMLIPLIVIFVIGGIIAFNVLM